MIGDPFGILGMDAAGYVSWLQLESPAGLPALAEVAEQAGLDARAVDDIRQGRRLANVELRVRPGPARGSWPMRSRWARSTSCWPRTSR